MNQTEFPIQSNKTLIKASGIAILFAIVTFITIVLPAEYNRDPTGVGSWLGLMQLSQPSSSEVQVVNSPQSDNASNTEHKDTTTVVVPANRGVEYKFRMKQFTKLTYQWKTNGQPLYFDFHGEPKGDTSGYFESYTITTADEVSGSMTVPFEGVHGWYWKNTSNNDVVVTLQTVGNYEVVGLIH